MIRRDDQPPQSPPRWILISQVEHARLSGELAAAWNGGGFPLLVPREEAIAAIFHHDDGWAAWERAPKVDPASGIPYSFTEMPLADALAIWSDSIASAARIGNLAAWMVAGHFRALLQGSTHHDTREAASWLADYDRRADHWLAAWQREDPPSHQRAAAEQALQYLQLFDALSLWLCCAERTQPQRFQPPGDRPLVLCPRGKEEIAAAPWPFQARRLDLEVPGRAVPAAAYADSAALAAAPSEELTLRWRLIPAAIEPR